MKWPGRTAAEIYQFALAEIRKLGWNKFDSEMFGHSLGLSFHENPLIAPNSNVRMEPGMVINIEIPVSPCPFPVEAEDPGSLVDGISQECAESVIPGQAGRVEDERPASPPEPDFSAGWLESEIIFADHAHSGRSGPDVAIGVHLPVADGNALPSP